MAHMPLVGTADPLLLHTWHIPTAWRRTPEATYSSPTLIINASENLLPMASSAPSPVMEHMASREMGARPRLLNWHLPIPSQLMTLTLSSLPLPPAGAFAKLFRLLRHSLLPIAEASR